MGEDFFGGDIVTKEEVRGCGSMNMEGEYTPVCIFWGTKSVKITHSFLQATQQFIVHCSLLFTISYYIFSCN